MNPTNPSPENSGHSNSGVPANVPPEPKPRGRHGFIRKYSLYIWIGGICLVAIAVTAVAGYLRMGARQPFKGLTYTVENAPMKVTIVERGSLESAENSDIIVRVKAGVKGSVNASIIKWVVDEGKEVKKDEKLVDFDDSGFQDQLKTQKITVNKAESDYIQARNDYTIQESQNVSDRKTAEVELIQAQLDMKKYAGEKAGTQIMKFETQDEVRRYLIKDFERVVEAESKEADEKYTSAYLQDVKGYLGSIDLAKSDRDSWMDRAAWSERMVKKGFYSLSQADADQSRLASMEIVFRKAQGDLDIYRIFEREKNITARWSAVKEAERKQKRVDIQADSQMEKKDADKKAKKAIFDLESARLQELEKDGQSYTVLSPQDGMIVYFIPEQARSGGGSQQATVAQGEPVREGQKLMRIPNLYKMVVNAGIHESMVNKIKADEIKWTGFSDRMRGPLALGYTDLQTLGFYNFAYERFRERYPEELRNKEETTTFPGHSALVRVDGIPGKTFPGRVRSVATVASSADWFSADVKRYTAMVSIDDLGGMVGKLKPGMNAEVTITADEIKRPVLQVPVQATFGKLDMADKRKVFVLDANNIPQEIEIHVGKSNDIMVEVISGLKEGDRVVQSPRSLLDQDSGMRVGVPSNKRGAVADDADKKGGKKDGGEQKMKGGGQK